MPLAYQDGLQAPALLPGCCAAETLSSGMQRLSSWQRTTRQAGADPLLLVAAAATAVLFSMMLMCPPVWPHAIPAIQATPVSLLFSCLLCCSPARRPAWAVWQNTCPRTASGPWPWYGRTCTASSSNAGVGGLAPTICPALVLHISLMLFHTGLKLAKQWSHERMCSIRANITTGNNENIACQLVAYSSCSVLRPVHY